MSRVSSARCRGGGRTLPRLTRLWRLAASGVRSARLLLMAAHPTDNQRAGDERTAAFTATTASPVLGREVLLVLDRPAHRPSFLCIGDPLMRVFGGHRPVDERARRVAVTQRRFAVLSVLKDHRIGAAADRGGLPHARRLDRLDADRSRREQSTEQHPLIAEPDADRLIAVMRLQRLAPFQRDVVREHDLTIVTANDAFAPGQLDQDGSHDSVVAKGTTRIIRTERFHECALAWVVLRKRVCAPAPESRTVVRGSARVLGRDLYGADCGRRLGYWLAMLAHALDVRLDCLTD